MFKSLLGINVGVWGGQRCHREGLMAGAEGGLRAPAGGVSWGGGGGEWGDIAGRDRPAGATRGQRVVTERVVAVPTNATPLFLPPTGHRGYLATALIKPAHTLTVLELQGRGSSLGKAVSAIVVLA